MYQVKIPLKTIRLTHCKKNANFKDLFLLYFLLFFNRENLKEKENQAQQHKRQISEACGENDYNTTREIVSNNIATLQEWVSARKQVPYPVDFCENCYQSIRNCLSTREQSQNFTSA